MLLVGLVVDDIRPCILVMEFLYIYFFIVRGKRTVMTWIVGLQRKLMKT